MMLQKILERKTALAKHPQEWQCLPENTGGGGFQGSNQKSELFQSRALT